MDSITINLPHEIFQALKAIAQENGKTVEEYVRKMIENKILATKPFDKIFTPAKQRFEDEVENFLLVEGIISEIPARLPDDEEESYEPIKVRGKPLSEMILEERE